MCLGSPTPQWKNWRYGVFGSMTTRDRDSNAASMTRRQNMASPAPTQARGPRPKGKPVRLALIDVLMPGMDGLALAAQVRRQPDLAGCAPLLLSSVGPAAGPQVGCGRPCGLGCLRGCAPLVPLSW